MSLKNLAIWFGISYSTIRKAASKKKYLKILESYCDFDVLESGSIYIKDIYNETIYVKNKETAFDFVLSHTEECWDSNRIDTIKRVSSKMEALCKDNNILITDGTRYKYVSKAKCQLWGKTNAKEGGTQGTCKYVWCHWSDELKTYQPLSEEERALVREAANESYGVVNETVSVLVDALKKHDITKEEFAANMADLGESVTDWQYTRFLSLVVEKLGFMPDRAIMIINYFE